MKQENKNYNNGFVGSISSKFIFSKYIELFFISLLLIPVLASASLEVKCPDPLLPGDMVAGTTYNFSCDLKNDESTTESVFVGLNITEKTDTFPVWLNDFSIGAGINSDPLNCTEKTNGTFYCYNGTEGNEYGIDPGISTLDLNITSKLNLYPADYIFSLSVFTNLPPQATTTVTSATSPATGGVGYVRRTTTTTTTTVPATTNSTIPNTTATTTTTTTTTTTIPPAPGPTPSLITGFVTFVSSPLGISLLLSVAVATVLIIIFYKKRHTMKKPEVGTKSTGDNSTEGNSTENNSTENNNAENNNAEADNAEKDLTAS